MAYSNVLRLWKQIFLNSTSCSQTQIFYLDLVYNPHHVPHPVKLTHHHQCCSCVQQASSKTVSTFTIFRKHTKQLMIAQDNLLQITSSASWNMTKLWCHKVEDYGDKQNHFTFNNQALDDAHNATNSHTKKNTIYWRTAVHIHHNLTFT